MNITMPEVLKFSTADKSAKELIEAIQQFAKQDRTETGAVKFEYLSNTSRAEKVLAVQNLYKEELQRRSRTKFEDFDTIEEFCSDSRVMKCAQETQKIMLKAIMPIVYDNEALRMISEFHYGSFGDSLQFEISDPTLYNVSRMSRDQKHTMTQRKEKATVSINTEVYGVTSIASLIDIMLDNVQIAEETMRMALSMQAKIYELVVNEFSATMEAITIAELKMDNWDEKEMMKRLRLTSAYNRSEAVIVCSDIAAKSIIPASVNTRILLTDPYNSTLGYMAEFNGYKVLVFKPVAKGDGTYGVTGLRDDRVYGISPSAHKIIHVAIGDPKVNTDEIYDNSNLTVMSTIRQEIGVKSATNAIAVRANL